jgi:hypothetical protein
LLFLSIIDFLWLALVFMFLCFAVRRIAFWTPLRAFTINSLLL